MSHEIPNIPEKAQQSAERQREWCADNPETCFPCAYRFSHVETDEKSGEQFYAFVCGASGMCGVLDDDGDPHYEERVCGVEKEVYDADGELVWQE